MNGLVLARVRDLFHIGARFLKNNSQLKTSLKKVFVLLPNLSFHLSLSAILISSLAILRLHSRC